MNVILRRRDLVTVMALFAASAGCQTVEPQRPAVLAAGDAENLSGLRAALARAMNRALVELGPGDPTESPTVSVLPPPLGPHEDRSVALPTAFDLVLRGDACFAVRRDTGEVFELAGVRCAPFASE